MRLAAKIFLANSLVILVFLGVAVWSIVAVTRLSVAHRTITVRAAEALRLEVSLREAVTKAHRLELRNLVFRDPEYAAVSNEETARIERELRRLDELLTTGEERARLRDAVQGFGDYRGVVARARALQGRGAVRRAEALLRAEAQPVVDRIVADLDRLVGLTQGGLDRAQMEATAALGALDRLRLRTWTAVPTALILAVLAAVAGTAAIAVRMTRSLRRLSQATKAVAEGAFREPLPVETKDDIGELARSFNSMAARLREVDEMKEQFYATVSHELRSPLMSMREAARIMEEKTAGPLTVKQDRLVAIIHKGAERLLRLVNVVLDLSRASAGPLPLERRWFELERAVARAVDELRPQAEQRGIALRLESGPGASRVFGDEDRIVQVAVNLIANALRFTSAGGLVTVRLNGTEAEAQIHVEDTGIGIRADLLPVVFDRFRQAHSGRGGTGLGLPIVRAMVEAHGGRVAVESEEGKGSRFTVSLPREAAALAAPRGEGREA